MNKYLEEDRLGSRIHLDIHLYAYCALNKIDYGGSYYIKKKIRNYKLLKEHIELSKFLKIPHPKDFSNKNIGSIINLDKVENLFNIINFNTKLYPSKNINNFLTDNFINLLRNNFIFKKKEKFTIVVHIRRGDVNPNTHPERYLPNEYYCNILELITSIINIKSYEIIIISESQAYESFECFKKYDNIKFEFDRDTKSNWENMINSDIFIMSKSSYSYVPALFCKGIVVYKDFWCSKLNEWVSHNNIKNTLINQQLNLNKKK